MRGRLRLLPLAVLALGLNASCGKRADPLAPWVKTPQPPAGLEVTQVGDAVEIKVTAPRMTTENRPLPVIELEWLQGPAAGDFTKAAASLLREEVAPGELRVKRFPLPQAEVRFTVRAYNGNSKSALGGVLPFKPMAVPLPPENLGATNTVNGVELRWTNPAGAEPWPTPSVSPSPSPSPSPVGAFALPSPTADSSPTPSPTPAPSESPTPAPATSPAPSASPSPSPSPSPTPTPTPLPPTGIRVFRTDGVERLVKDHLQASSWTDPAPQPGETPCYTVRYAASFKPLVESVPTAPVCVEVKDLVPPEPPGRIVGDIGSNFVELSWLASPSTDVAFYRLYRTTEGMPRALVIQTDGLLLRVRDANIAAGPRIYEVVAVDKGGNESVAGPQLRIVIP